ncbi:cytochrome B561, N terminal-domain-containing protein [Lobosporangium transversale]|uniref:Cytochrome B561, N terminal-domain-containing protein n=1 Tax=Lobosporangium transversale TaxID=64571 RepID=A0A1Y2GBX0_9FUNG|nr:cytochrome B561, N terminal-domain-containing protein [Lobosporangium transversale]ORZ05549.1 cytochrome B561, N terminal-domain-containing protein [Lobosporangium transversale]|eukprot:XP_021877123.1 cytochrome B561, N terminal-domain-containing protein [Lobosporangium transversale]
MTSSNNFEYEPLTPSQRALLGLDPVISKVPGAVPIFKRSVSTPHNLTEKPIMSTYVSPSQVPFSSSRTPFQKPNVGTVAPEYRDAATILSKSMARSFNQVSVQDKADLNRLMKSLEAREELQNEWKGPDADSSKRSFGLHSGFGAPQNGLQGGVDMAVPDLRASINARGPVPQYRHALRTTLSKDHTSKTDLQKDGLYVVGHSKVLKNLKVSEQQLDRWVFNLRKWLWNKIVMHVCNEMEAVDEELAKQGLSYLDCKNATMFYCSVPVSQNVNGTASTAPGPPASAPLTSSLAWGAASVAAPRLPSAFGPPQPQQPQLPTSLQDLEARYGSSNIVKQRLYLEAYLAVPGCANRKYVVERLQAMGPLLTHFIWDSHGVTWDGAKKSWTPDLPSDAQIIMHLFMTYIDTNMPSQPAEVYDRFLFTYKHYVPMENKPDPTTALQIKQTSKFPPNYSLVVGGSLWEVVPKRLNVWYTMVLFIYMVMKENGGYLGQINIGTQWIGLGNVVEGYDL